MRCAAAVLPVLLLVMLCAARADPCCWCTAGAASRAGRLTTLALPPYPQHDSRRWCGASLAYPCPRSPLQAALACLCITRRLARCAVPPRPSLCMWATTAGGSRCGSGQGAAQAPRQPVQLQACAGCEQHVQLAVQLRWCGDSFAGTCLQCSSAGVVAPLASACTTSVLHAGQARDCHAAAQRRTSAEVQASRRTVGGG